jgi:hypothetical protein
MLSVAGNRMKDAIHSHKFFLEKTYFSPYRFAQTTKNQNLVLKEFYGLRYSRDSFFSSTPFLSGLNVKLSKKLLFFLLI